MAKKFLLLLMLLSMLIYAGCGGGNGGGSKPTTSVGAIQGTVSFGPSLSSLSVSSIELKPQNFVKKSFHQSKNTFMQQSVPNEKIVKLRPGLSDQEAANVIASLGGTIKKKLYGTESTYLINITDQAFKKSAASQSPEVEYIENNLKLYAFAEPNDEFFTPPYNWNYNMLNLQKAWDVKKGNHDIIVAVLDTGISIDHEDLKDNLYLVPGCDLIDKDDDPSDTKYDEKEGDVIFSHGTHVAGIISAVTDNKKGIAGVAWNVKIMPIRVLDSKGEGTADVIAEGINLAVEKKANVINLSLGITRKQPGDDGTKVLTDAIDNAIANGITVVAAAGNDSKPIVAFPANHTPVIAVSALDHSGFKAPYSNYGSEIDFCAPGGGEPNPLSILDWVAKTILSTIYFKDDNTNDYTFMIGTSMAAPHISGLAALLYSKNPTITPTQVEENLKNGCIDLGAKEKDSHYGHGLPDAYTVLTGGIPLMANVKVFIGTSDGTIISNLQHVGASGSFTLSDLSPGTYTICAFEDTDNDNVVDTGVEKFGYRQVTLTANSILIGVDIYL